VCNFEWNFFFLCLQSREPHLFDFPCNACWWPLLENPPLVTTTASASFSSRRRPGLFAGLHGRRRLFFVFSSNLAFLLFPVRRRSFPSFQVGYLRYSCGFPLNHTIFSYPSWPCPVPVGLAKLRFSPRAKLRSSRNAPIFDALFRRDDDPFLWWSEWIFHSRRERLFSPL